MCRPLPIPQLWRCSRELLDQDLIRRLRGSLGWVAAQFVLTLVLILLWAGMDAAAGQAWWQVVLTLLVPLLLAISALELEAGTMRALSDDDGRRVKLVWGACALLVWIALFWACWAVLDWCDDQIPLWAGYLNSRASCGARATIFTYDHLQSWITVTEWVFRWIIVPGKIIPYAMASAQWGWRIAVAQDHSPVAELAVVAGGGAGGAGRRGAAGPFLCRRAAGNGIAPGLGRHLKLPGAMLLAVGCWVLLLAWAAVLLGRSAEKSGAGRR